MAASGDEDQFAIQVTGTGPPEVPYDLHLLNASITSLRVGWGQGFNGGYKQTFTVRWKSDYPDDQYRYADVAEMENMGDVMFTINGLKPNTQYEIGVSSRNDIHGQTEYTESIHAKTSPVLEDLDGFNGYHSVRAVGYSKPSSLFIIVAACVIGGVVIFVNIVVITYLIRKRHRRGNQIPGPSSAKSHILPQEKQYQDGHYCRDPHHRHLSGEHCYLPDPLLIGKAAQTNPVYGYGPPSDHIPELGNAICQSTYMPGVPPALYTNDATYPQIHHTHAATVASGQGHRSEPKFIVRPRSGLRRRQSFGDALDRGQVSKARVNDQVCYHRNTMGRLSPRRHYPGPSYSLTPLDNQQRGEVSSRTVGRLDLLGYTKNCYIDQLEALQKGDSPTKKLLLNGGGMSESVTWGSRPTTSNTEWCDNPGVVV